VAVWVSESPVVSGAITCDTAPPITHSPAAMSMHGPMPMLSMPIGSRNVPAAAPIRLNAVDTPTPVLRSSVGNTSLG
jgi:hypothetical protein